ncbi:MAG: retroviral-like aspartic protease family protein [Saprospiraceae bacterium]|nr:retroviral-like aspartic protease family protein [Saprospiraceae bacterium]
MGLVYANITLTNVKDQVRFEENLIKKDQIRQITATMLVDSGAYMMAINETVKTQLGLEIKGKRTAQLAKGQVIELGIVGPIEVKFENRDATCNALVLPGDSEMLLGAIPMEEMDVLIHPTQNKLVVNPLHPNIAQLSLK